MKGFKPEEVYEELPDMFLQLHEFFAHNQIAFASKVLIPPLMKEMKELHPAVFSTKQLEPFHKNLACVGYSLSYLDATPELLQARVLQGKDVMYAQLTVGVRAVEVDVSDLCNVGHLWMDFSREARHFIARVPCRIFF